MCIFRVRDRERESRPAASVKQKMNEWWKQSVSEPRAAQRGDVNFGWLATFTVKLHRCVVIEMISFSRNVISLWTPRITQLNCYIFKANSPPSMEIHRGITPMKIALYSPQKWKVCCNSLSLCWFVCGRSFPCYHVDLGPKASSFKIDAQESQKTWMLRVPRPYTVLCEE